MFTNVMLKTNISLARSDQVKMQLNVPITVIEIAISTYISLLNFHLPLMEIIL